MNNDKTKESLTLDNWNKRLDDNFESAKEGNSSADEKAEEFNDQYGSDALRKQGQHLNDDEDFMKLKQPTPGPAPEGEIEREE